MKKFTKMENAIISSCLSHGLSNDLKENQAVIDAGKNPIMTAEYIQMIYLDLQVKVDEMTKKK